MSLCAPFLAFDPVMQLLVGVVFMPAACSLVGLGCEDGSARYPAYHLASLACVAYGAFLLGSASGKVAGKVGSILNGSRGGGLEAGHDLVCCCGPLEASLTLRSKMDCALLLLGRCGMWGLYP
jgi:hypothetical protein